MKDKKGLCKHKHTNVGYEIEYSAVLPTILFKKVCADCNMVLNVKRRIFEIPKEL